VSKAHVHTPARRRATALVAAAILTATLAAGCGTDPGPESAPAPAPPTTSVVVDPAAATQAVTVRSDLACGRPTSGDVTFGDGRRALVRSPGPKADALAPLVIVLHGFTAWPEQIEATSGWTSFLAGRNAVVAYPEGTPLAGGAGFGWDTGTARYSTTGIDDVGALHQLLELLIRDYCVDPAHVMLTGASNGGGMALRAACDPRWRGAVALVAPVIPAIDAGSIGPCESGGGPPLRLIGIASKVDATVPYDGVYPRGEIALLAQESWFTRVASARNGCSNSPPDRLRRGTTEIISPVACVANGRATLVAVDDSGHNWPGGSADPGMRHFQATDYLWAEAGFR
jgi:polyhydroxybutyrate depolymerase